MLYESEAFPLERRPRAPRGCQQHRRRRGVTTTPFYLVRGLLFLNALSCAVYAARFHPALEHPDIAHIGAEHDAFDVMFRANMRNVRMLKRWMEKQPR